MSRNEYRTYHALYELDCYYNKGSMTGTSMSGAVIRKSLTDASNKVLLQYLTHLDELEYSDNSKRLAKATIHTFLLACPIDSICDDSILDYIVSLGSKSKSTVKGELKRLKRFLVFLWNSNLSEKDYSVLIISSKKRKNTSIPSVYSPSEVAILLNYLATHGRNRFRNFAIALLIAVYGFRAGDIVNLKLSDINWDAATILIIQVKTKTRLEHCLTDFCGKVLANYLLNDRPDSTCVNVFLKEDGNPLVATSVSSMIMNGFVHSDIVIGNRKHGSHSLRHSLASNMLEQGTGILDISHVLGHDSVDTTKNIYAKVDIGHLRLCELEVPVYE
jgi:site-specific recombinase XerD